MAERAAAVGKKKNKTSFWFNCLVAISGPVDCAKAPTITSTPPLNDSRLQRTLTVTRHYQRWGDTFHCGEEKLLPPSLLSHPLVLCPPQQVLFLSAESQLDNTEKKVALLFFLTRNPAEIWFKIYMCVCMYVYIVETQKEPLTKDSQDS